MCLGCTPNVGQGRRHSLEEGVGGTLGVIWGIGFHQGALNHHVCGSFICSLFTLSNERDDPMTVSEVLVITRWWNVSSCPKPKHRRMNVLNLPDNVQSLPNSLHNLVSVVVSALECIFHMLWHLFNDISHLPWSAGLQYCLLGTLSDWSSSFAPCLRSRWGYLWIWV